MQEGAKVQELAPGPVRVGESITAAVAVAAAVAPSKVLHTYIFDMT